MQRPDVSVPTVPISRINYWSKLRVPSHFSLSLISADHKSHTPPPRLRAIQKGRHRSKNISSKRRSGGKVRTVLTGRPRQPPPAAPERTCLSFWISLCGCVGGTHLGSHIKKCSVTHVIALFTNRTEQSIRPETHIHAQSKHNGSAAI